MRAMTRSFKILKVLLVLKVQNIIAEQKLRTQRILGELIAEGQKKGTIRQEHQSFGNSSGNEQVPELPRTISEVGLNKKKSSTFQQIASISEDDFEEFIQEKKQAVRMLTFVNIFKSYNNRINRETWTTITWLVKVSIRT